MVNEGVILVVIVIRGEGFFRFMMSIAIMFGFFICNEGYFRSFCDY